MSNENNMELWLKVDKTEPELIKEIESYGVEFLKTVPHINRIKRATELFGVYGNRWGLCKLKHSEQRINNVLVIGLLEAKFFVKAPPLCETEFWITNSIAITRVVNGKLDINASYRKAIESDTINKALSRLGFNADIYSEEPLVKSEAEKQGGYMENELSDLDIIDVKAIEEVKNDKVNR